jgi:hypothetical protein
MNTTPSGLAPTGTFTVPSRIPGAVIGTFTATDPDPGETLTYSVSSSRFVFVGDELRLAPNVDMYPFAGSAVTLSIRVTDSQGAFQEQAFTFNLVQTPFIWNAAYVEAAPNADLSIAIGTRFGTTSGDTVSLLVQTVGTTGGATSALESVNLRMRDSAAPDTVALRAVATAADGFGTDPGLADGGEGNANLRTVGIVANALTLAMEATGTAGDASAALAGAGGGDAYGRIDALSLIADTVLTASIQATATAGAAADPTGLGGNAQASLASAFIRAGAESDALTIALTATATDGGFAQADMTGADIGLRGGDDVLRLSFNVTAATAEAASLTGGASSFAGNAGFDTLDLSGSLTHGARLFVGDGPGGIGTGAFNMSDSPIFTFGLSFQFSTFESFIGTGKADVFVDGVGSYSYALGDGDTLIRQASRGADTVIASPGDDWEVVLPNYGGDLDSFAELETRMRQVGADVVIGLGNGASLTFLNTAIAQLGTGNFSFIE